MKKIILLVLLFSLFIFMGASHASMINPGFEDYDPILSGWEAHGIVSQVSSGPVLFDIYNYNINAPEGDSMALLSAPGFFDGGFYTDNYIRQTIDNFSGGVLAFIYNIYSTDWNGLDRFTVDIDAAVDTYDFYWEIDELNGAPNEVIEWVLYNSGWQLFSYDLGFYTGPVAITLGSGNGVDNEYNTWTYVDCFNIAIPASTPEPCTGVLLFFGLVAGGFSARRFDIRKRG